MPASPRDGPGKIARTMITSRPLPVLALSTALAALAACGSSSRAPATAAVRPTTAITEDNALAVASTAYRAAAAPTRVLRVVAMLCELPPLSAQGEPPQVGEPPANEPPPPTVNPEVQLLDGPEGGTAIRTWDDRDGDGTYSTGDEFALRFDAYGDGGCVLDGDVALADLVVAGDMIEGLSWRLAGSGSFVGMLLRVGDAELGLDGTFRFERELRATVRTLLVELTTPLELGTTTVAAGTTLSRNDYLLDFTMALFADGEVNDPALGGTLAFRTGAPLTGMQVLADPWAGTLEVHGSDNVTLTLQPIDFFNAELLLDENGDEEAELTLPVEFASLWAPLPPQ
jgi:hypothetical protein